jgi:hypothetical protein
MRVLSTAEGFRLTAATVTLVREVTHKAGIAQAGTAGVAGDEGCPTLVSANSIARMLLPAEIGGRSRAEGAVAQAVVVRFL